MQEKIMVSDTLFSINATLQNMGIIIAQTANPQLRQAFIQIRNAAETSQYKLYELAINHGYYEPSVQANKEELRQIRTMFNDHTLI